MIIPFKKEDKPNKCSFCSKEENKVKKLVKSTLSGKTICNECIAKCNERLKESG